MQTPPCNMGIWHHAILVVSQQVHDMQTLSAEIVRLVHNYDKGS